MGLMVQGGVTLVTVKLFMIVTLIFITSPVATHAVAQAAKKSGLKPQLKSKLPE